MRDDDYAMAPVDQLLGRFSKVSSVGMIDVRLTVDKCDFPRPRVEDRRSPISCYLPSAEALSKPGITCAMLYGILKADASLRVGRAQVDCPNLRRSSSVRPQFVPFQALHGCIRWLYRRCSVAERGWRACDAVAFSSSGFRRMQ